jgi:RHS repeat-associated protein
VTKVLDPEEVETDLAHDFAGRRIAITRGSRTWTYGYDKNGNMQSELSPCSPQPTCQASYTTTIAYDNLDRPASKVLAPRTLSSGDLALFGADHETFQWDYGYGRKGHLYTWYAYAPGASGSSNYVRNNIIYWDAAGRPYTNIDSIKIAGYLTSGGFTVYQDHSMNGVVQQTNYGDQMNGGSNQTASVVNLDGRGLPASVLLHVYPPPAETIAVRTRNVAGLVTLQHTAVGGNTDHIDSLWVYDKLGRVASQTVNEGPGTIKVAEQDLQYFGNDDPSQLDQYLGASNHKTFTYGFDLRHQLTNVNETTTSGYFSATYAYGNAGRFATAVEHSALPPNNSLPPNSELTPRNVTYNYPAPTTFAPPSWTGATPAPYDAEEVLSLSSNDSNFPFAVAYDYDAIGNQTDRCLGTFNYNTKICSGEEWKFLYDGKDQLRRVTHYASGGSLLGSEEYWYDNSNHRTQTLKRDSTGAPSEMIWWNGDSEAHYDNNGVRSHVYSHITLGTAVARVDRTSNTITAVEHDFHGLGNSTLAAVDQATGAVNASFSYAPFGEVIEALDGGGQQSLPTHRSTFNNKYTDTISSLKYYGHRYYDDASMTWTQGDRLYRFGPEMAGGLPRRANLYTNDVNNPLRYVDPDGQCPILVQVTNGGCGGWLGRDLAAATGAGPDMDSVDVLKAGYNLVANMAKTMANDAAGNNGPGPFVFFWMTVWVGGEEARAGYIGFEAVDEALAGDALEAISPRGGPGAMPALAYQESPKHGPGGWGSPAPTNGQRALRESLQIGNNSPARISYDAEAEEIVMFRRTQLGHGSRPSVWHGYTVTWDDLTAEQRKFLMKEWGFSANGRPPRYAPADANRDGTVTDDEESAWMKKQQ